MNIPDTIKALTDYNAWRRGDDRIEQPQPTEIGHAIDSAIRHLTEQQNLARTNAWLKMQLDKALEAYAE
jgi:hypothetical protein